MWRVIVVEDDPLMRQHFANCITNHEQLELIAAVGTINSARECFANTTDIDVMLVDLGLPDGNGVDLIYQVYEDYPKCESLVISMYGDEENVLASIEAGALGYIQKDANEANIADIIISMKNGASPISPMIARRVLNKYRHQSSPPPKTQQLDTDSHATILTDKEQEVLQLIARGYGSPEVADLLKVKVSTVRSHIKSIYKKLSVHSRSEAVFEAVQLGIIPEIKIADQ